MVISFDVTWCFFGMAVAALVGYGIMAVINFYWNLFRDSSMLGATVLPYVVICALSIMVIVLVLG